MASFEPSPLPVDQLESLRFKANQIIERGNQNYMPPWPEILSKYNMLLSQTHNFSTALVAPVQAASISFMNGVPQINKPTAGANPYEKIALHPSVGMTDMQLDNEVIPLLRNQQTTDVLRMENDTVRRLSEHMATRGSVGVLGGALPQPDVLGGAPRKPEYEDVLRECEQIRVAHDQRVERAVRAVTMLRDKFELRQRVQVEVEEPEELSWDPRLGMPAGAGGDGGDVGMESAEEGSSDDDDEDIVEGELIDSNMGGTTDSPAQTGPFAFAPETASTTPADVSMF
ncbi:hypothetical protein C8J57DRAFT_1327725 [Mycena rebaudengoi]|nr:hypothetical protein C8J57DRAFT_1327725 [Mycena rebaudengoi]